MEESFEIHENRDHSLPVLALRGEIDLASAPQLREALGRLSDAQAGVVVLDLSEVTFLDSTGLGALTGALQRTRAAGGDLRLVVNRPNVLKVLEITGLDSLFQVFENLEEALR